MPSAYWIASTLVNMDCLWVVHYGVSAVSIPPLRQKAGTSNDCLCATLVNNPPPPKKTSIFICKWKTLSWGWAFCGMNDKFHWVILLPRLPACLTQFCSTGNSHKESSYQVTALLIILMITVNLDGLVYALSTWRYEREADWAWLSEGAVWFYGQTH